MPRTPKLFSVEQTTRQRRLVVRLPLPRNLSFDHVVSSALVVFGVIGLLYVFAPVFSGNSAQQAATTKLSHAPATTPVGLPHSVPTHLEAVDIGLSTTLIELGNNPDGSLETPASYDVAGWYKFSPTPGEIGPAVIAGHVDNYLGPAVFFRLKELQPGQSINITRQDGSTVGFTVDKVALFDQQKFPTHEVYGDIGYPGLRLITCGGAFNPLSGHYSHNTVVYASRTP